MFWNSTPADLAHAAGLPEKGRRSGIDAGTAAYAALRSLLDYYDYMSSTFIGAAHDGRGKHQEMPAESEDLILLEESDKRSIPGYYLLRDVSAAFRRVMARRFAHTQASAAQWH
jgi:hypothetical protein